MGCTEVLELRGVRGTTVTLEAVTSHPTDRSATLLNCEKGAQSAGAPDRLHRAQGTR
ncbi:hypothetical protein ABZ079_29220 [Streptomyces sp. NPDC006314]|uniref:hypothetical protein n=1 Tax=Streptomyces sp. NPDC006314 TaxID=3154475 RepID=UPI0033B391C0